MINHQANLIEPYTQGINVQITTKDIKKEDKLCMKSPTPPHRHCVKGVFKVHPPVSGVKVTNNTSIPQVRVNTKETEHDTTFEIS